MAASTKKQTANFEGMVRVGQAAKILGVCKETLRNWDRSSRLVPQRNPITGYRYYPENDLQAFYERVVAERECE